MTTGFKIAILDDYADVAPDLADWSGLDVTVYAETLLVDVGAVHDTVAELVEGVAVTVVGAPGGDENVQIS